MWLLWVLLYRVYIMFNLGLYRVNIRVIQGVYRDNGKENGNYYIIRRMPTSNFLDSPVFWPGTSGIEQSATIDLSNLSSDRYSQHDHPIPKT